MTFDVSKLTHESRILVGAVQVNKSFIYHDASYECAAWWEDREAQTGVHPVYLSRSYHHPKHLTLTAHIKAKVVDDYFPGLWGGVAISREPYKPKHIGEERTIYRSLDIVEAIESTGNSPGSDIDIFVDPSHWHIFAHEAEMELREAYSRFPEFWNKWNRLNAESFATSNDGRDKFHDEFRSRVGMIAHFGSLFEKWARRIEKINWRSQYHNEGSKYDTAYQRDNFAKNTEWTKAILNE